MVAIKNLDACIGCGSCVDACPAEVLKVVDDKITIDQPDNCVECGACAGACPVEVLEA